MATLKPSSRFVLTTSKPITPIFAHTQMSSTFLTIPSILSLPRPIQKINCSSTRNEVVVAERLNNVATPWLMLPSETDDTTGEKLDCFYSLADHQTVKLNRKKSLQVPDTAKCIASTKGWLGFVDTKDCSVYLSNPFLNDVVELPSLETLPSVLSVRRDHKTNKILSLKVCISDPEPMWEGYDLDSYTMKKPETMAWHITNLSLSSPDPRSSDCVVMAIQRDEFRRLAYCPISRQFTQDTDFDGFDHQFDPTCWTGLQEDYYPGLPSNQVVYDKSRALFYALFETGIQAFDVLRDRGRRSKRVFVFPIDSLERTLKRAFEKDGSEALKALRSRCKKRYYLVTLKNGDVLLIVRHYEVLKGYALCGDPHKTLHFDVFRIVTTGDLEHITCLNNDRAIFIGWNQSFCIKASSSPGVNPNSIYFTDDVSSTTHNVHSRNQWGHDMGIFNMEDGAITPCYPYQDEEEQKKVPLSTPLFWVAPISSHYTYMSREHGVDEDQFSING